MLRMAARSFGGDSVQGSAMQIRAACRGIATAGALVAAAPCSALTLAQGAENVLYFEHARLSSESCESRGFRTSAAYRAWRDENDAGYRASIQAIRAEAEARGVRGKAQDDLLAAAMENQARLAGDHIARRPVDCGNFAKVLRMYSDLMRK